MAIKQIAAVAGVAVALVGCGVDGPDMAASAVGAGFAGAVVQAEAPGIEVIATEGSGHGDAHDEAASSEEMGDGDAGHDEMGDAGEDADHEAADAGHDEMADAGEEADHAVADAGHDEMADTDHDATGDAGEEADHEAADAGHDEMADAGGDADHDTAAADHGAAVDPDPDAGIVVSVEMFEFGYVLDRDTVPVGEPVTFRFVNGGQDEHEAMFGSSHQQEEFAAIDGHGGHDSGGHHGDIAALTLDSEAAGEIVMVFDSPGEVLIGCHLPGHWEAGMSAGLNVVSA